jgi:hypothetical protein
MKQNAGEDRAMEQLFDANASAKEITRLVDGAHLMVEPDEKLACALQTLLADHHLEEVTKAIKAQGRFPLVFFDEGGGPYKAPPSMKRLIGLLVVITAYLSRYRP